MGVPPGLVPVKDGWDILTMMGYSCSRSETRVDSLFVSKVGEVANWLFK